MNPIEKLARKLDKKVSALEMHLDPSSTPDGSWWLDLKTPDHSVVVEWRPSQGFGITSGQAGYGEGPDELYPQAKDAEKRLLQLLQGKQGTRPPHQVLLRRLRELRGLTQVQLALLLGVKQSTVSHFEAGEDMHLSALRRLIESMGGSLRIQAVFPEDVVTLEDSMATGTDG